MASATTTTYPQRPHMRTPSNAGGGSVKQSLGALLTLKVKTSRVLLVGAGGIGCELLKNLVCCGFGSVPEHGATDTAGTGDLARLSVQDNTQKAEIVVIDLDTIDLSNLNRQFLFRKQHIKKPKALVAKETASQFNPAVNIDPHHASIFDAQYDVEFFEGFDVVFNALDNVAARRHVNRMCLAADVPLIESGTTGFNGQVQAIRKGITECYDCTEKPVQKSFAICTIRSTPSQPIHCIVWAKSYLLPELFGASEDEDEAASSDMKVADSDNAEELAKLKEEAQALKNVRSLIGNDKFASEVFNKVFHDDILRLRSMSEMWKSRKPPEALRFEAVCIDKNPEIHGEKISRQDQIVWGLLDNLKVFIYSAKALSKRTIAGGGTESAIEFDKDDKDTLDFVASAANLRAHVFGIPVSSEWDIKQMAGNIIPAIATSNAITASLCVFQAFKILRTQLPRPTALAGPTANNSLPSDAQATAVAARDEQMASSLGGCRKVYLESKSTERLINSEALAPPRADCPVCSPSYAKVVLSKQPSSTAKPTLQSLVTLLKSRLKYEELSLTLGSRIIYDPDLEDNLEKSIFEILGLEGDGAAPSQQQQFLTVTDEGDDAPKVDLILTFVIRKDDVQKDSLAGQASDKTGTSDGLQIFPENLVLPAKLQPAIKLGASNPDVSMEDNTIVGEKRKREETDAGADAASSTPKRAKTAAGKAGKDDVLVIAEDDGIIDLD